ncbi:MAG TPA: 2-amino-4-hydroxy-6-hydroxymethyldihydropteridine diphosphokinase [Malonomonas sp.]
MTKRKQHRAFLALGGNLENPQQAFYRACRTLAEHPQIELRQASSLYRTPAVGGPSGQPDYLNAVIEIVTEMTAEQLLGFCQQLEAAAGRRREIRWAPRTLDIDLLFYDNLMINTAELSLPHPRLQERHFVLLPLAEIAPELRHPQLGAPVRALLERLPAAAGITRLTEQWIDYD